MPHLPRIGRIESTTPDRHVRDLSAVIPCHPRESGEQAGIQVSWERGRPARFRHSRGSGNPCVLETARSPGTRDPARIIDSRAFGPEPVGPLRAGHPRPQGRAVPRMHCSQDSMNGIYLSEYRK